MSDIVVEESSVAVFTVEPAPTVAVAVEEAETVRAVQITQPEVVIETTHTGLQGPPGPEGPRGDPGGFYVHIQDTPDSTWTVTHNLGFYPAITVHDSTGREVVGDVQHVDTNVVVVSFSAAFAGRVTAS